MRYGIILIGIYVFLDSFQTAVQTKELRDISVVVFSFYVAALIP